MGRFTTSLLLRAASPATAAPSSIRIVLDWRRPHPAVDASGDSRADRACLTVRRDKRLRLTGIPRFADAGSPVLFVFLDMPAAACLGLYRRDHSNNRQRSCVHGQCEKPCRKFAHAPLPLRRSRWGNVNPVIQSQPEDACKNFPKTGSRFLSKSGRAAMKRRRRSIRKRNRQRLAAHARRLGR